MVAMVIMGMMQVFAAVSTITSHCVTDPNCCVIFQIISTIKALLVVPYTLPSYTEFSLLRIINARWCLNLFLSLSGYEKRLYGVWKIHFQLFWTHNISPSIRFIMVSDALKIQLDSYWRMIYLYISYFLAPFNEVPVPTPFGESYQYEGQWSYNA